LRRAWWLQVTKLACYKAAVRTIAIVSRKGGAGKTTLATHLAVAAEAAGLRTALLDLDPQASAALWADRRGSAFPAVLPAQAPRLAGLLAQAQAGGADLVLLDTPPEADGIASAAAAAADLTLIPCRPSALDLDAVAASVRIAAAIGRGFAVVINAAPVAGVEVAEMRAALAGAAVAVAPVVLHQRKAFSSRMQEGRTAPSMSLTARRPPRSSRCSSGFVRKFDCYQANNLKP
jgi:chromosome partitioning protein